MAQVSGGLVSRLFLYSPKGGIGDAVLSERCRFEYVEGVESAPIAMWRWWPSSRLRSTSTSAANPLVPVYSAKDEMDAQLARAALEAAGIAVWERSKIVKSSEPNHGRPGLAGGASRARSSRRRGQASVGGSIGSRQEYSPGRRGVAMQIVLYIILGLAAGVLSGLIGIGGGVIIVPALVFFFKMSQHEAQGTTLALLVPPIGLLAAWTYYRRGYVDLTAAGFIILGFFLGGLLGARLATGLSNVVLTKVFGIALLLISLKMIFAR